MNPTTQEALDLLTADIAYLDTEIGNHTAQIANFTAKKEALQLKADLLQGIIDTPANDLVAKQAELDTVTAEKEALESQIEAKGDVPVTKE